MSDTSPPVAEADSPEGAAPPGAEAASSGGRGLPAIMAVICLISVAIIALSVVKIVGGRHDKGQTVVFVVPKGTALKASFGQKVDVMPARVLLHVGDSIQVRNEDTKTATVGPFTVRPGETITQQFENPQVLKGECTLSGSGSVTIIVT